jgi:hypothetical protein
MLNGRLARLCRPRLHAVARSGPERSPRSRPSVAISRRPTARGRRSTCSGGECRDIFCGTSGAYLFFARYKDDQSAEGLLCVARAVCVPWRADRPAWGRIAARPLVISARRPLFALGREFGGARPQQRLSSGNRLARAGPHSVEPRQPELERSAVSDGP